MLTFGSLTMPANNMVPSLLSIVTVIDDTHENIADILSRIDSIAEALSRDHEVIVVTHASDSVTLQTLRHLVSASGLPNLQVLILSSSVDLVTGMLIGVQNSIGDLVASVGCSHDQVDSLQQIVNKAKEGFDIVYTKPFKSNARLTPLKSLFYTISSFSARLLAGVDFNRCSPINIAFSRKVVTYLLQFKDPSIPFRGLATTSGFSKYLLETTYTDHSPKRMSLRKSLVRGMRVVTSSSQAPLRFASLLFFATSLSILISITLTAFIMPTTTLLLAAEVAVLFLLNSFLLFMMSEYILGLTANLNQGPAYFISAELTSVRHSRKERLNIATDEPFST